MAFGREPTVTAVGIGGIVIKLSDLVDAQGEHAYLATFDVNVLRSDGIEITRSGNLLPHITTAQRNALLSFMQSLRTQAENELLPPA